MQSIQLTPGVKTVQDRIDGLYIQKGTPDQNLLLLDGIQVIRGEHLWGYYNAFNQNAIKNVTLHKTGFSSKFGDRLSSIIELEGDTGNGDNVELGAGADIFCMNAFIKIPYHSKFRSAFAMRKSFKSVGFNNMYYNFEDYIFLLKRHYDTNLEHGNLFRFYDLVGKLEYDLSAKNKIAIGFSRKNIHNFLIETLLICENPLMKQDLFLLQNSANFCILLCCFVLVHHLLLLL